MKSLFILVFSFLLSFGIFYGIGELGSVLQKPEKFGSSILYGVGAFSTGQAPVSQRFRLPFSTPDRNSGNYEKVKSEIVALRDSFRQVYLFAGSQVAREGIRRKAEISFAGSLIEELIPFWYGTKWDFNGMSRVPGEGSIACGYFVTTLLQDAGLPIKRIKLAQAASFDMISQVCQEEPIWLTGRSPSELADWIRSQPGAIFLIGLDNHTGFLLREKDSVWFVHASYAEPAVVIKERAESSKVLAASRIFVVGTLVANDWVTDDWLGIR